MSEQAAPLALDPAERWVVTVTMATVHPISERALVRMDERAEADHDASVAARAGAPGLVFTTEVSGAEVAQVPGWVAWIAWIAEDVSGYGVVAPMWLVDLHVRTPEQYEADALTPDIPALAGASDAAELLGVSRQRLHQLAVEHASFPAPVARLGGGPVWTVASVEAFSASWERRPGRRRKPTAEAS